MAAITIDLRSRTPIYEQIIKNIKEQALSGILKPDEQIPSIRQLTQQIGINPNTIQKAYAELERQGIIYTFTGRGAFVSNSLEMRKLTDAKREEILKELENSVSEAKKFAVPKDSIKNIIDKIYNKNSGDIQDIHNITDLENQNENLNLNDKGLI